MAPSTADWLIFVFVTVAYLVLAVRGARAAGRGLGEAVAVLVGTLVVFFVRSFLTDVSLRGTLRSAAGLAAFLLLVTRGRPARLFDLPGRKAMEIRRLPRAQREALAREERNVSITQAVFLVSVVVFVIAYALSGATILD